MNKKRILFIINPISGTGKRKIVEGLIPLHLDANKFSWDIAYTQHVKHGVELSKKAAEEGYDCVVAVGGDGSVNEIGQSLIGTSTALAIIPTGSGNGFARDLKIPLSVPEAICRINDFNVRIVDTGILGGKYFLGTAGMGFDALISKKFDESPSRGLKTYVKLCAQEFLKSKNTSFLIKTKEGEIVKSSLLFTIANTKQYGNNAIISPNSKIDNGSLQLVFIRKVSLFMFLPFVVRLFTGRLASSKYFEDLQLSEFTIVGDHFIGHTDGEPVTFEGDICVKVLPSSLKVLV